MGTSPLSETEQKPEGDKAADRYRHRRRQMFYRYARRLRRVETNLRKERQMEGIAKAKAAGVYKGRPVSIDPAQVQQPKAEGMGPSQIAKQLGIASVWPEHGESHGYAAMVPSDGTQRTIPRLREHLRSLLMLFGLGRIQRGCLRVIEEYEAVGKRPTTVNIAAQVYRVRPDRLSEAQHVTTERALASLRQRGLVSGRQDVTVCPDGRKHFAHKQRLADGSYRAERCCVWSRNGGPDKEASCSMEAD